MAFIQKNQFLTLGRQRDPHISRWDQAKEDIAAGKVHGLKPDDDRLTAFGKWEKQKIAEVTAYNAAKEAEFKRLTQTSNKQPSPQELASPVAAKTAA